MAISAGIQVAKSGPLTWDKAAFIPIPDGQEGQQPEGGIMVGIGTAKRIANGPRPKARELYFPVPAARAPELELPARFDWQTAHRFCRATAPGCRLDKRQAGMPALQLLI